MTVFPEAGSAQTLVTLCSNTLGPLAGVSGRVDCASWDNGGGPALLPAVQSHNNVGCDGRNARITM